MSGQTDHTMFTWKVNVTYKIFTFQFFFFFLVRIKERLLFSFVCSQQIFLPTERREGVFVNGRNICFHVKVESICLQILKTRKGEKQMSCIKWYT